MTYGARLLSIAVCALSVCGFTTCTLDDTSSGDCDEFASTFTIQDRMQQSVTQFVAGDDPITFRLDVTNESLSREALTNPDRCPQVEFQVLDSNDQLVWSSLENIACAQVITTLTYEPGETETYTAEWQQLRRDGTQVPAGRYTARARDRTECTNELSQSAQFTLQ